MKKSLTIVALVVSSLSFGQVNSDISLKGDIYKSIPGLKQVDSISFYDIIGSFSKSGYVFRLDSNMTFQKIEYDCLSREIVDGGSWKIQNNNVVVLKSKEQTLSFDIVKFDEFYFFILPPQKEKFITDLKATKIKLKNLRPFKLHNRAYSADYLVGYSLAKKYYVKEIENLLDP